MPSLMFLFYINPDYVSEITPSMTSLNLLAKILEINLYKHPTMLIGLKFSILIAG